MGAEHLTLLGRDWLGPAGIFLAVGVVFLAWGYWRSQATPGLRLACLLLKLIGIAALAFCLLDPQWTGQRAKPGQNQVAILADNSESMTIHDPGQKDSRGEQLRALLREGTPAWRDQLNRDFRVRRYTFDARLKTADDFTELAFDGRASAMGGALKSLADLNRGQPVAAVLLFTDGNATDLKDGLDGAAGLPPVYPVLLGGGPAARDIAIQNVAVAQTAFEDAPVTIQASVEANGYTGREVLAQVLDRQGNVMDRQTQTAPAGGEALAFRFQIRPRASGLSFFRLQVSATSETNQFNHPEQSAEATLANNIRWIPVDRGQDAFRILYVAGRANWEYKFLKRALDEDSQIQISSLIRAARREPKFAFQSRAQGANPLFSGYDKKDETTERYDQPVMIRLNVRDEEELRGGFPKTPEELYAYQAVIVDDLEAGFFTADQHLLLQKFVSERGGGFMMLGGVDTFQAGQYNRTPVGDMLPVYLDSSAAKPSPPYKFSLTREGWLQPWARLRDNEREENTRLASMPGFQILNAAPSIKPGASVLATVAGAEGGTFPALVAQRFGNGRVAAITLGDLWRWGFHDAEAHRDMDKAWRQMIRWLVADVPSRVTVSAEPQPSDPNQAVRLQVRVRDAKFQPVEDAQVTLRVQHIGGNATNDAPIKITAELAPGEPGLYQAPFIPREAGGYQVEACATNNAGAEIGRARAGWATDLASEEFRSLQPNRALMEAIARQTSGEVVDLKNMEAFVKQLPYRQMPVTETWSKPLWHQPWMFLGALLCFVGEWGLRRWKGLP